MISCFGIFGIIKNTQLLDSQHQFCQRIPNYIRLLISTIHMVLFQSWNYALLLILVYKQQEPNGASAVKTPTFPLRKFWVITIRCCTLNLWLSLTQPNITTTTSTNPISNFFASDNKPPKLASLNSAHCDNRNDIFSTVLWSTYSEIGWGANTKLGAAQLKVLAGIYGLNIPKMPCFSGSTAPEQNSPFLE